MMLMCVGTLIKVMVRFRGILSTQFVETLEVKLDYITGFISYLTT